MENWPVQYEVLNIPARMFDRLIVMAMMPGLFSVIPGNSMFLAIKMEISRLSRLTEMQNRILS